MAPVAAGVPMHQMREESTGAATTSCPRRTLLAFWFIVVPSFLAVRHLAGVGAMNILLEDARYCEY